MATFLSFRSSHKRANVYCPIHFSTSTSILVSDLRNQGSIVDMANKLQLLVSFSWLLATTYSSPLQLLPSMDVQEDNYEISPDEADDVLQFLLMSKYDRDVSDYPVSDQIFDDQDQPMSFRDGDMPMSFQDSENPTNFNLQNKLPGFDNDDISYGTGDAQPVNPPNALRDTVQNFKEDQPSTSTSNPGDSADLTSISPSSTTPEPDPLVSMPPVMPNNQGQKEFVMLRPPSENHRKLDHWMEEMEKGLGMPDAQHMVQKRKFAMR
ncbi:hypothetical protein JTE90_014002 [Oedothorax gibbosus]|uniref:Uncharacterized protein n=1 Tax=Oedothorax gibbosus TaxID=931172 RepID=A0AAV6U4M8_9ARAC|nr:hypothetical protein JTE90_014002 [Oedothorax gibbosus]